MGEERQVGVAVLAAGIQAAMAVLATYLIANPVVDVVLVQQLLKALVELLAVRLLINAGSSVASAGLLQHRHLHLSALLAALLTSLWPGRHKRTSRPHCPHRCCARHAYCFRLAPNATKDVLRGAMCVSSSGSSRPWPQLHCLRCSPP